jgi:hypothetical protein
MKDTPANVNVRAEFNLRRNFGLLAHDMARNPPGYLRGFSVDDLTITLHVDPKAADAAHDLLREYGAACTYRY